MKPNVLFIFSDQQRWDTLGCYGQQLNVTPNLDKMASEGVLFNNAFTCQPVCGPARACLQTGKYATEIGCHINGIKLPQNEKTIAHYFNEAGYETAYVGKWHLASTDGKEDYQIIAIPEDRRGGYKDYWMAADVLEFTSHGYGGYVFDKDMNKIEFDGYRADAITDYAIDYLKQKNTEEPFFMMISYIEPHHQNDRTHFEGPIGSKERFKNFEVPGDLIGTEGNWREEYPDYLGCCASIDENVGRIRKTLEEKGVLENTVIFYCSDHGSHFCTRNSEYKRSCHDGCTHIPLIAYGPGFYGGKVYDGLVSLIDLPLTFLTCAGIDKPDNMQGIALQEQVLGKEEHEEVFMQISESQVGRAIRTQKWKYSVTAPDKHPLDSKSDVYVEDFLYDLENDPHERNNLVCDNNYAEIRKTLSEKLKSCMIKAKEEAPKILPKV